MNNLIYNTIINSINEFNETLDEKIKTNDGRETPLFGKNGVLDSLSLVNLIVKLEEDFSDKFDQPITLTSEKAMSRKVSPFLTIGTLTDYVEDILSERK